MYNLCSSYLYRLKKSRLFFCMIGMAAFFGVIVAVIGHYEMQTYGVTYTVESRMGWHAFFVGFFTAVFVSWFLGTENAEGGLRNKLIAGHKRQDIYLASFAVCAFANMLIVTIYLLTISVFGVWLLQPFEENAKTLVLFYGLSILISVTFTSLYVMFSMMNQNKATTVIICLVAAMFLALLSFYVEQRLHAPKMLSEYEMTVNHVQKEILTPNPKYLDGTMRTVFQFLSQFLTFSQAGHLMTMELQNSVSMICYDIFIILGTTVSGLLMFRKKDIK